jgi:chromosome segregation ATPase
MGRAGVTLLDVEKAVMQLQGRGKNPTVDTIRELLGTGSKSTIIQHLKAWRSKNDESQGKLPQELLALVTGLWERLNGQAEQRIIEIESSSEEQLQIVKQSLQQHQQEHIELKTKFHQLEEKFSTECRVKVECEKQLQLEKQEHDKLRERDHVHVIQLKDQKAENARLHQLAANIQANLEHYQNAMQQARIEQSLAMEKKQIQFQQELTELQRELALHRKNSQEREQQSAQKNKDMQLLKEQSHLLQLNHDSLIQQLQESSRELIIFKDRFEHHQQQFQTYQKELNHKNQQLIEFEKQTAILADQRDRLQKNLSDADNKIEILRHEKLFLTQEKSQLEGHLKQLQQTA